VDRTWACASDQKNSSGKLSGKLRVVLVPSNVPPGSTRHSGLFGSRHWSRRTPPSSWYQSGKVSVLVADTAAWPPVPVPLSDTEVTAGVALLVTRSVVGRAPRALGATAALIRQVPPFGATGSVQWLMMLKSAASPPWSETAEIASRGGPLLVTVTSWSARPKTSRTWPKSIDDGDTE